MGMREGSDPLALSRGTGIRGSCFFRFFARTRSRGCERVPTLSRSPMGLRFAAPTSFVSSNRLAAEDASGFRPSRALPWGLRFAAPTSFVSSNRLAAGGCERVPTLSRSPTGAAIRGSYFFRFFSRTRSRGCERVPSLSLSPVGTAIRGFLLLSRLRSFPLIPPA